MTAPNHNDICGSIREVRDDVTELKEDIAEIKRMVAALSTDVAETKEIVAAWKSVKLWAQFAKWLAGFVAASAAAFAVLKGFWHR